MSTEIELKAWVDDAGALRARLASLGRPEGDFLKEDTYWRPKDGAAPGGPGGMPASGIRVRRERRSGPDASPGTVMVTFKMKEVRDGVEINREREFRLQDGEDGAAALEEMLGLFGLEPRSCKRKRGSAWDCGGVTAELHEVEGLGHFLELEILAEDGGVETVRQARAKLLDLLARCGIDRAKIESRYYTELLEAKQGEDDHE